MTKIRVARKPADAYQHGNLAEALVQAGLKLLTEGGVEKLSLRAAAQLAGVSHAAPYRHFKDKDALVAAIAERGFRLLTASMKEQLAQVKAEDAAERLRAAGVGYVRFATRHPAYLQVIFGGLLCKDDLPPELAAAGAEAYQTLRGEVGAGLATGRLRPAGGPEEEERVALACWAMVHGLSTLLINGAIPRPATEAAEAELARNLIDLLGRGIRTGPATAISGGGA